MNTDKIQVSAIINADKKKVWSFYTEPKHIINWNFAAPTWHCPKAKNNLTIGGTYLARMEAKDGSFGFDFEAIYTEISINNSFTYQFEERFATIKFTQKEHQTEINITFDAEKENSIELQKNGWQSILNNFKNYVETN